MTPKEKAQQLFNKMCLTLADEVKQDGYFTNVIKAKQCALIAIDLAIEAATSSISQEVAFEKSKEYWYNVKLEIIDL